MTPADSSHRQWIERQVRLLADRFPRQFEPEMEASYPNFYVRLLARLRGRASLVTLLMWASFLLWDLLRALSDPVFKEIAPRLALVRVVVAISLYLFRLKALSRRFELDDAYANRMLLLGMATMYVGMCTLTVMAPAPYKAQSFYIGMMVCLVGLFSLFGLRTREALIMAAIATVGNIAAVLSNLSGPPGPGGSAMALKFSWLTMVFLSCFTVIGVTLCVLNEVMTRRLFESQHALARSSDETARQQSELLRMKEANRAEAVQRNSEKSLFIASAVHDLRQPVQSLSSAIAPLKSAIDQQRTADMAAMLDIIERSTQVLRDQLGAILDISRIEAGQVKVNVTAVDLTGLLQEVCTGLHPAAQKSALTLSLRMPETAVQVASDASFLRRIVANLVDNGIKYSDPAKRPRCFVKVVLDLREDKAILQVRDNGIGIDESALKDQRIFQPFMQLRNRHPEADKGVGLGLAIVKGMLDRLPGHQLTVASEWGVGSCFTLQLPLSAGGPPPAARPQVAGPRAEATGGPLQGKLVLLVEDDELVRSATQASLTDLGALCEAFGDMAALVDGLEDILRMPDLVLTDYRLPEGYTAMDVLALLKHLYGAVPSIVWSGTEPPAWLHVEFPEVMVLRKPVDLRQLEAAMASLLPRSFP